MKDTVGQENHMESSLKETMIVGLAISKPEAQKNNGSPPIPPKKVLKGSKKGHAIKLRPNVKEKIAKAKNKANESNLPLVYISRIEVQKTVSSSTSAERAAMEMAMLEDMRRLNKVQIEEFEAARMVKEMFDAHTMRNDFLKQVPTGIHDLSSSKVSLRHHPSLSIATPDHSTGDPAKNMQVAANFIAVSFVTPASRAGCF
ncbi:hypothetical protein Ahy_A08g037532 isoform A [Arachis hypogaea]|uniref:Uncharacterized protein n=1 Tax=Arachis hypogaea TaxID=3818 RepID=A0A445BR16_ARAHY|nr:hypothetical protein Ahy_A08g037532 isoform A [Arachis hypogaea]